MQSGRTTPSRPPSSQSMTPRASSASEPATTSVQVAVRIRPQTAADTGPNVPVRFQRIAVQPVPGSTTSVAVDAASVSGPSILGAAAARTPKQYFSFDRVLGPQDGQSDAFAIAEPLIDRFLEGYNATTLAYGQSGAGKSHSMGTDHLGPDELENDSSRLGIIPRAITVIFERLAKAAKESKGALTYTLRNSYIELYNEDLIDLLAGHLQPDERPTVTIREDKAGGIMWSGLREAKVESLADVMANLDAGSALRQTNSTDMNSQSSRSHAIFSIVLTQRKYVGTGTPSTPSGPTSPRASRLSTGGRQSLASPSSNRVSSPVPGGRPTTPSGIPERPGSRFGLRPGSVLGASLSPNASSDGSVDEWVTVTSKFNFVDLAGSERLKRTSAAGERVKEGISINAGLHALGNVISALGDPTKARSTTHIPYRDSKLTRLLQDSLGGNAHTLMIACVSPTEINLGETLNTLKFANRARNIKNRAELNEIEVGWDDVDHLQQLVVKLRGELASFRAGMLPIAEEGMATTVPRHQRLSSDASRDLLELQSKYTDLASKHAKMTAEMARVAGTPIRAEGSSLSPEDFAVAMAPVVEEYEKSISALEGQLSLTRGALAHTDEALRDANGQFEAEKASHESTTLALDELRARVIKLSEREASTEAYVRDLESRLTSSSEGDNKHASLISDLRRDLARHREVEGNSEQYIRELEARLAKSEGATAQLRQQVETAERELARRDAAYQELEGRLLLLDSSAEHKLLVTELDHREAQLAELQDKWEAAQLQFEQATQRADTLQSDLAAQHSVRSALEARLANSNPISPGTGTPPYTPSDLASALDASSDLNELQQQHAQTVTELEVMSSKYQAAQMELDALGRQLHEARRNAEGHDLLSVTNDVTGRRSPTSPTKPVPRSPTRNRRSAPIGVAANRSFLGRPAASAPSAAGLAAHSRSSSLSSELSSAQQGLRSFLPASTATTPRSISPIPSLRDSVAGLHAERSYESLTKEVRQLQDALTAREEEIGTLERSLSAMQSSATSNEDETEELADRHLSNGRATPDSQARRQSPTIATQLSPQTYEAFKKLKADFEVDDEANASIRVDELMRSMAVKETAHKELVEQLQASLSAVRRQHDALEALSRDQLLNASTEIEGLRSEHQRADEAAKALRVEVDAMAVRLRDTEAELLQAQAAAAAATRLREESDRQHLESVAGLSEQRQAADLLLRAEHDGALQRAADAHESMLRQLEADHTAALLAQVDNHDGALKRSMSIHTREFTSLADEHAAALRSKDAELDQAKQTLELERSAATQTGREEWEATSAALAASHAATTEKMRLDYDSVIDKLKNDHILHLADRETEHTEAATRLRAEHESVIASAREQHEAVVAQLGAARDDASESARQSHAAERAALVATHASELTKLRDDHDSAATASASASAKRIADLQAALDDLTAARAADQATHAEALDALNARFDSERTSAAQQAAVEHSTSLAELEAKHGEALQALKAEYDAAPPSRLTAGSPTDELKRQLAGEAGRARDAEDRSKLLAAQAADAKRLLTAETRKHAELSQQLERTIEQHNTETAQLRDDLETAVAELQRISGVEPESGAELQEALDALSTLEKALLESQDERERLMGQMEDLQRHPGATEGALAQRDLDELRLALSTAHAELAKVRSGRDRQDGAMRELAQQRNSKGLGINSGYFDATMMTRDESSGSSDLEYVDAQRSPMPVTSPPTPSLPLPPLPSAMPTRLTHGSSAGAKPPPATPPPTVPPPPLPIGSIEPPLTSPMTATPRAATGRTSVSSMATRSSQQHDVAPPQTVRTSNGSMISELTVDSRVQRKLEEQEAMIAKLNKQLNHCESDLRANIDLVNTLEGALNDSERNIRKTRLHLADLTKERDTLQSRNDELQRQVDEAEEATQDAHQSVLAAQKEADTKLAAERARRDQAKQNLDRQMEEMRARKSKFACF